MSYQVLLFFLWIVSSSSVLGEIKEGECQKDSDCDLKNSICLNSQCVCRGGYVMTGDMTQCIPGAAGYSEPCEDSVQCSYTLKTGGQCRNGSCYCAEGFHYLQGRCWRTSGLGDDCTHDENCYVNYDFESTSCDKTKKCVCADGYYQREYSSCRRKAGHGEPCGIALDCQFQNAVCSVGRKCVYQNETDSLLSNEIHQVSASSLKPNFTNRSAVTGKKIGDKCQKSEDCEGILNSYCNEAEICACKQGFYGSLEKTTCFPEVGSKCKEDSECVGKNMFCRKEKSWCTCKAGFVTSEDNRFCDKQSRYLDWSCLSDRWCSLFGPGGVCVNKKCRCSPTSHYVKEAFFCWNTKKVGEECKVDQDCGPDSNIEKCQGGNCTCMPGYHPSDDTLACHEDSKIPGKPCMEDHDCVYPHGACNMTAKTCSCKKGYIPTSEGCRVGIGGDCNEQEACSVDGSECNSTGKCVCSTGKVPSLNENKCLPEANKYKDKCEELQQCLSLLGEGTACEGGVCLCKKGYHFFKDGYPCFINRMIGQKCHRDAECYLPNTKNTTCLNGSCRCTPPLVTYNHTCIGGAVEVTASKTLIQLLSITVISVHIFNMYKF